MVRPRGVFIPCNVDEYTLLHSVGPTSHAGRLSRAVPVPSPLCLSTFSNIIVSLFQLSTMTTSISGGNDDFYPPRLRSVVRGASSHEQQLADGLDSILAKELYAMSVHDRDASQEEIHGVRSAAPDESPEKVDEAFWCFQNEIDKTAMKKAYDEAVSCNSYYVLHDRDFRIRFLRADFFDAKKAACRFLHHLDLLLDLFGPNALQRPLRHSDLSKTVKETMRRGRIQILPNRDRAGRIVLFFHRSQLGISLRARVSCFDYDFLGVVNSRGRSSLHGS
jgi:hypothetical protein